MYPILFHLGPVAVHSYGVMLMVGFLAGIALSRRQAQRRGLSPDLPLDLGIWILIASVVLARGLFVALHWGDYAARPFGAIAIWREGGLSFFGGLVGGVVAAIIYARRARLSFWLLADVFSPGLALGYAITRIGCFLNGCCYGVPTDLPWGVVFPGITTEPSHPTQLYSSLGSLLIMAMLLWVQPRLKARGQLFLVYLMLYAVLRGLVEILRRGATAEELVRGIPVTQAQFVGVLLLIVSGAGYFWLQRRGAPNPLAAQERKAAS